MKTTDRIAPARAPSAQAPAASSSRRTWPKKLLLAVVSILVTLALLEIGFRIAGYEPIYSVYSKPEVFWRYDPRLGWTLEPGADGTYIGPRPFPIQFRTPVHINSRGLRGPEIDPLPPGGVRVLVLGDSMTAGFEVPEESTYSALAGRIMQRRLERPVQVINAGVRGYGTDQVLLLYRERLRTLHPDVVVYHTTTNDPDDDVTLHRVRRPFGKPAFALEPGGRIQLVGVPVPSYPLCSSVGLAADFRVHRTDTPRTRALCWLETRLADHSALFSFITTRIERNPDLLQALHGLGSPEAGPASSPAPWPPYAYRLTAALIRKLASDASSDGAQFVLLAQRSDLRPLELTGLEASGADIVPLDRALGPHPGEDVRFPVDGHYNERGHRLVAELLAGELTTLLKP